MIEKYIIEINGKKIAIKYNFQTNRLVVGGYFKDREYIDNLITGYIIDILPVMHFPQRNKIKYEFTLGKKTFDMILEELENNNFVYERVTTHGRLIR